MSKKERRVESKKRKAIALLHLVETRVQSAETESMDCLETKRPRSGSSNHSNDNGNNSNFRNSTSACLANILRKNDGSQKVEEHDSHDGAERTDEQYTRARRLRQELQKTDLPAGRMFQPHSKCGASISLSLKKLLPFSNISVKSMTSLQDRLPPVFLTDLQQLLLLSLFKNFTVWTPRWCRLSRPQKIKSVSLIILRDVSISDFEDMADCFAFLGSNFSSCVEMVCPAQCDSTVEQELSVTPLILSQMKRFANREAVREKITQLACLPDQKAGERVSEKSDADCAAGDTFPRTSLLLSTEQLMQEGYPIPVHIRNKRFRNFDFSLPKYKTPTASSPMFGVDCEMVETLTNELELARVSIVNEGNETIYNELVKPHNPITNYHTRFSGITAEKLAPVTKRLADVQRDLRQLLPPDAILCGQSLCNDLYALKLFHPYVVDTSVIFNSSGDRKIKCGLQKLASTFLSRRIQNSVEGHCSVEDAKAALDLVKLKLKKGLDFGDAMLGGVYFPNMRTYFKDPSKAQNVEEVFSTPTTATRSEPEATSASPPGCKNHQAQDDYASPQGDKDLNSDSASASPQGKERPESDSTSASSRGRENAESACFSSPQPPESGRGGASPKARAPVQPDERRKAFFGIEGSRFKFNVFEFLSDYNFTVGVVGSRAMLSQLSVEHKGMEGVEVCSDEEACAQALRLNKHRDFTWVELVSYSRALAAGNCHGSKKKELLAGLDSKVGEVVRNLRPNSLITILLTGRQKASGQFLSAATFVTVR